LRSFGTVVGFWWFWRNRYCRALEYGHVLSFYPSNGFGMFSPRPPAIQCLVCFFAGGGIAVRVEIRCEIDVVLTCDFCKNHIFFIVLASDSICQPPGEGDFAIHYTIEMQVLGSLTPPFLFVYKCGYLRALTVYVWSEHPCGISLFCSCCFCCFFFSSFFLLVVG
jgi:hypothetical protein